MSTNTSLKCKFEVFRSTVNNQFYFRLRAENSEPIFSSEGYIRKSDCLSGVTSVRKHATQEQYYNRLGQAANLYFTLEASNGEPLGRSEMYTTLAAREIGIASVKANAPLAPIVDLTVVNA
ncbi:YegP family protein [uncultured Fibrella sp.]|uniref:YegP family protein n=1 Tax=uncultured Fibrella sp. TaxID=1284596 RepID=UPI0035CADA4F